MEHIECFHMSRILEYHIRVYHHKLRRLSMYHLDSHYDFYMPCKETSWYDLYMSQMICSTLHDNLEGHVSFYTSDTMFVTLDLRDLNIHIFP